MHASLKVSVIIVSYNVYPFLDNCLRSVRQALRNIPGEIIVVDNASVDRTPQLLREHFPDVRVIANADNKGFAAANNQGLRIATGEYVLLLNPDTVVNEDTISTCIRFMDDHPVAGAAGVRMLDGSGQFLPESKRGLPTLLSSFMKMTGLYKIFPASPVWNRYYQGHIGEHETAPVEVLSGAFMFIRHAVLKETGLLDEDFFMYGEDIDLSYRITKAGYLLYYVPATSIIHYKGESTKKTSINYLVTFYKAMLIFTEKHLAFKGQQPLIKLAIYLHGFFRYTRQLVMKCWPFVFDACMLYGSFFAASQLWANFNFHDPDYFNNIFYSFNLPIYTAIGMLAMFLNGAYDLPYEPKRSYTGFITAVILILILYAFLPIGLRTSRMVIVLGSLIFFVLLLLSRNTLKPWRTGEKAQDNNMVRRAIIVGGEAESGRIKELINRSSDHIQIIGTVSPDSETAVNSASFLGSVHQLREIVQVHQIKEIIFSAQDVPFSVFTGSMSALGAGIRYMLAASTTMNIVGSMNKDTEGESYGLRVDFNLSHPAAKRSKRIFDMLSSLLLLAGFPLLMMFVKAPLLGLRHVLFVLSGKMTWVAYHPADPARQVLPKLDPGVLTPAYPIQGQDVHRRLEQIDFVYARDYHWTTDLSILLAQWKRIGQQLHA